MFVAENRNVAKYEKVKVVQQYKSVSFKLQCSLGANIWLESWSYSKCKIRQPRD